jgi:hypothetical protein
VIVFHSCHFYRKTWNMLRSVNLFGQGNWLYNNELYTDITTCLMCFNSTRVCEYWHIPKSCGLHS